MLTSLKKMMASLLCSKGPHETRHLNHWLCPVGRDLGVVFGMSQSLTTNPNQPLTVVVTYSSSRVQFHKTVDVKWSSKGAKVWSWSDNQPESTMCAR